ncbi:NusG domain II-containing protein [Clostridiales bacterium COT073_COT-073]|nr:NusG domain II-containing protein [Clostridiales bacterium COT073_COT-073]
MKKIKKGDLILLAGFLLLAVVGFYLARHSLSGSGDQVVIKQDGKIIATYSLNQEREIPLKTEWGQNTVVIRDGRVFMAAADCRDQYCVKHRPIMTNNDMIICLPHKLVVEIVKTQMDEEVDSIAN